MRRGGGERARTNERTREERARRAGGALRFCAKFSTNKAAGRRRFATPTRRFCVCLSSYTPPRLARRLAPTHAHIPTPIYITLELSPAERVFPLSRVINGRRLALAAAAAAATTTPLFPHSFPHAHTRYTRAHYPFLARVLRVYVRAHMPYICIM